MNEPTDSLDLLDYRRVVAELYATVRHDPPGPTTWSHWRVARDELFATHPQSALRPARRESFTGLPYFPYDPSWRLRARVEPVSGEEVGVGHSGPGTTTFRPFGRAVAEHQGAEVALTLYWLAAYGGGVFLPFRDGTSGTATYGGGRYLLDTVKGADLGHAGTEVTLDFNYAYHPSCVHDDRWSCPLAPPENWLEMDVRAGERL